jgi:glutathione S-transferase
MSGLIIYGNSPSNYVRAVRMTCAEKGIEYTLETFSSLAAIKEPENLTRHPFGKIPSLEHGDVRLFETSAICRYIDEAFDGPALQPEGPVARARMEQWISATNAYVDTDIMRRFVRAYIFPSGPDGQPDRNRIDKAIPDIRRDFEALDAGLSSTDFLAGDQVSIADLMLAPIVSYGLAMPEGDELIAGRNNLKAWTERMFVRDSFTTTTPPMPKPD